MIPLLLLLLSISLAHCQETCPATFSRQRASSRSYPHPATNVEGRARSRRTLLGIFPLTLEDCTTPLRTKGYNGFQRAEAMIFALDVVNEEVRRGNRNVSLDGHILDSCKNDISATDALLRALREEAPVAGNMLVPDANVIDICM